MEEVKVKKTTWGVVKKGYLTGFKMLKYKALNYYKTQYGSILFPHTFYVTPIYLKKKDVTYFAIVDIGFLDLFGPFESDSCIVLRYPGNKENLDDVKDDDVFKAAFSELYSEKEEQIKSNRDEEA